MTRQNLVVLVTLALSSLSFAICAKIAGPLAWKSGRTDILAAYAASYLIALVASLIGVTFASTALSREGRSHIETLIYGVTLVASLAFALYLFVLPHLGWA